MMAAQGVPQITGHHSCKANGSDPAVVKLGPVTIDQYVFNKLEPCFGQDVSRSAIIGIDKCKKFAVPDLTSHRQNGACSFGSVSKTT